MYREAQFGGARAVIGQHFIQSTVLLIGVHVLEPGQPLHLLEQRRPPLGEILDAVGLQRVLIHGVAGTAADTQILRRLQKRRGDRQTVELRAQPSDDLRRTDLALRQRIQGHINEAGVGGTVAAGEGDHVGHGRIAFDDADDLLDRVVHRRKGGILRPLDAAD